MKKILALTSLFGATLMAAPLQAAETWAIDKGHSHVGFSVAHMVVTKTRGNFKEFSGTLTLDTKNIAKSKVDVTIDVGSIDTNDAKRDGHLKSPDFFDVKKHPKMTFKSTSVKKAGKNLKVSGNLTINGITKPVVLDVEGPTQAIKDPWGGMRRGVSATTKIDRREFGLKWNNTLETGGLAVGHEVTIQIEAELVKK